MPGFLVSGYTVIELFSYTLSAVDVLIIASCSVMIGMAKTGVFGVGMIVMPLLVLVFGGKLSTGYTLMIMIYADLFAVWYYNRHADWQMLRRLLPLACVGIILGTAVGEIIDDSTFRLIMAVTILVCLAIMIWRERRIDQSVPTSPWFAAVVGISGGFTTMVGNLGGPVMGLYFLAMRLPKNQFIGTAAWCFLLMNLIKVPLHVAVWETITVNSVLLGTVTFPLIAVGAFIGVRIVRAIPEQAYRYFIIAMTAVAALAILI